MIPSQERGARMTVIYIDLLFGLNLCANYLLLLVAGRMCGKALDRRLLGLAAALGALYAALLFLPGLEWLAAAPCKLAAGVLMVLTAYGREGRLGKVALCFFAASAALGGLVWAAELMGGHSLTMERGVLYSYVDLRLLLVLLAACYAVLSLAADRTLVHRRGELAPAVVRVGERTVELTALLDTGNTLTDPATNRPVLVAEGACCRALLPAPLPLERPVDAVEQAGERGIGGFRLLPYRAVGVDHGLLLAVKADSVVVGTRDYGSILVALSPTPVSDGGGYQALIGGDVSCG